MPNVAFAEDEPKASEANTISGNLFDKSKQEDFENVHYEIDTAPHKDDEKGFSQRLGAICLVMILWGKIYSGKLMELVNG